jgi:hypothetical protein
MKCPYCKADMKAIHDQCRPPEKHIRVIVLCFECGQPVLRMVYGFRKLTGPEFADFAPQGLTDAMEAFTHFKGNPPYNYVTKCWAETRDSLVKEWTATVGPPKPEMMTTFELLFYLGAKAAKDAIREILTDERLDHQSTTVFLGELDRLIENRGQEIVKEGKGYSK